MSRAKPKRIHRQRQAWAQKVRAAFGPDVDTSTITRCRHLWRTKHRQPTTGPSEWYLRADAEMMAGPFKPGDTVAIDLSVQPDRMVIAQGNPDSGLDRIKEAFTRLGEAARIGASKLLVFGDAVAKAEESKTDEAIAQATDAAARAWWETE